MEAVVLLQGVIQQSHPRAPPQMLKSVLPRLTIQKQLEFHTQTGSQGRRHSVGRIAGPPPPGPAGDRGLNLGKSIRCQIKAQTGAVTSPAKDARWVIFDTGVVEKRELPCLEMHPPAVGIDKRRRSIRAQQEGHGIHREITARKVLFDPARLYHGILARLRINLCTGTGQVEPHSIKQQLCSTELLMQMQLSHAFRAKVFTQTLSQDAARPFPDKIEIRQLTPGLSMVAIKQQITNRSTHQCKPASTNSLCLVHEQGDDSPGESKTGKRQDPHQTVRIASTNGPLVNGCGEDVTSTNALCDPSSRNITTGNTPPLTNHVAKTGSMQKPSIQAKPSLAVLMMVVN